MSNDRILASAYNVLATEFNRLVKACIDKNGEPKAPTKRDLNRARGYLPAIHDQSFEHESYLKRKSQ